MFVMALEQAFYKYSDFLFAMAIWFEQLGISIHRRFYNQTHKMKIRRKSIWPALAVTSSIITSQLSGAMVFFDFRTTGGSGGVLDGNGDGPSGMGDTDFDSSAAGDTITLGATGDAATTLTTTVVGFEVPTIVGGAVDFDATSTNASFNISGQDALGINNLNFGNTPYQNATGQGSEANDFNPGESATITFSEDVIFTEIELESVVATDVFDVLVGGVSQLSVTGDDSFIDDLGGLIGLTIPAGTEVTFAADGDLANSSFRIETFTVDIVPVPEPSSLALIALGGLAIGARRKRA